MARTRYVHRTILSTEAEVMTVNTATKEVGSVVVPVQGKYESTDDAHLVKAVKKGFDALHLENTVFASITAIHTVTKLYKMLESQFMALAESEIVEGEVTEDEDEDEE